MRAPHRAVLPRLASLSALLALAAAAPSAFAAGPWTRHPSPDVRPKPAAVPAGYVFTHNGFLNPSCVYRLQPGEYVEADFTIRGAEAR